MKKIILLTLVVLAAGSYWIAQRRNIPHLSPATCLEARLVDNNALLVCTNVRVKHIKNKWGNLALTATEGYVTRDHVVQAKAVTVTLEQPDATLSTITALDATLTPTTHTLNLAGNVHAEQGATSLNAEEITINTHTHTMMASGKVVIKSEQGLAKSDQVSFNHQEEMLKLEGHVQTNFGLKKS